MKNINNTFKLDNIIDIKKQDDEDLASIIDMLKKSTTINKNFSNDILYTWYDVLNTDRIFKILILWFQAIMMASYLKHLHLFMMIIICKNLL